VFVYIPPLCDVHPRAVAEEIERLRAALELEPQQLLVLDRMAEVYLTHLRSLRVDVIDLRPAFRAVEHQLYWPDDWHIDVRGHRTIAEALRPLVNAARPAAAQRVAAAARAPARSRTLLSPGAPDELLLARASAVPDRGVALDLPSHVEDLPPVRPLGQPRARALYPFGDELEFDALAGSRVPAGLDLWVACAEHPEGGWRVQTNSRGLRSKRECAAARPAFRAVFTGDGRTLTACAESEAWPALVERELARLHPGSALECWNATAPGATLQQQLGTLKRVSDLTPDLLVVALDGDDDLLATLRVARVAATLRKKRARDAGPAPESVSSQGNAAALTTLAHFRDVPADTAVAVHTAVGTTLEIQELCRSSGARLLVLYVPSAIDVEWSDVAPEVAREAERLQLTRAGLHAMDQLATQYLGELRKRGIDVFDCRRVLRDAPYPCYWRTRSGLNLAGQRVVARGVQPALVRASDARRR
jgi:hypothetical protein